MDIEELAVRAQKGEREAFNSLLRLTARLVWAHVYGIVHDPAIAEDVFQMTYIRAWKGIPSLREPKLVRAWLMSIARRAAWEAMGNVQPVSDEAYEVDTSTMNGQATEVMREKFHAALRRLPEKYRVAVALRYVEGMSRDEISNTIGIEVGSVRGILDRGVKMLKAELKKMHEV